MPLWPPCFLATSQIHASRLRTVPPSLLGRAPSSTVAGTHRRAIGQRPAQPDRLAGLCRRSMARRGCCSSRSPTTSCCCWRPSSSKTSWSPRMRCADAPLVMLVSRAQLGCDATFGRCGDDVDMQSKGCSRQEQASIAGAHSPRAGLSHYAALLSRVALSCAACCLNHRLRGCCCQGAWPMRISL